MAKKNLESLELDLKLYPYQLGDIAGSPFGSGGTWSTALGVVRLICARKSSSSML